MAIANPETVNPVLTTLEAFKLKWAVSEEYARTFMIADPATRRDMLQELALLPRESVGQNGLPLDQPTRINSIEWFMTPREACQSMYWLVERPGTEVREILSKNVPLMSAPHPWTFVGYKGGSEPGVLSMTYVLEKEKTRACLSMTWNDPVHPVQVFKFMEIVEKTLKAAEKLLF
jgi:hypothetical protein